MQDIYYRALVMHVYKTTSVLRIQEHKLAISSLLKKAWITNLLQVELNLEHQLIESCLVWNCTRTYYNTDHQFRTAPASSSCTIRRQHRTEHVNKLCMINKVMFNIDLKYKPSQRADRKHLEGLPSTRSWRWWGVGRGGNLQDEAVGLRSGRVRLRRRGIWGVTVLEGVAVLLAGPVCIDWLQQGTPDLALTSRARNYQFWGHAAGLL